MHGTVYGPPSQGLPFLAVVLDNQGEVVVAKSVKSVEEGGALIAGVFAQFAAAKNSGEI